MRPGHRGRVDPPVDLELGAQPADGTCRAVAVDAVDLVLQVRQLELGHAHRRRARGGGRVEPDHQPPGEHRRERGRAPPSGPPPGSARRCPSVRRGPAPRPCRAGPRRRARSACRRCGQRSRKVGRGVARRGGPEADGSPSKASCAPRRARRRYVDDARTRGVLQDRLEQPLRRRTWSGRPPRRRSSSRPSSVTVISRTMPDSSSPTRRTGGVAAAHSQTRVDAAAPRRARAQHERRVAQSPGVGTTSRRPMSKPGKEISRSATTPSVAGHVGHGHPHPVDRLALQSPPRRGRWPGRRQRCGTGPRRPRAARRTGTPEKPSTPAWTVTSLERRGLG